MQKRTIKESTRTGRITRSQIRSVVNAVHVIPATSGWQVKKTGPDAVTEIFETQEEAVDFAKALSQDKRVDLIIHVVD